MFAWYQLRHYGTSHHVLDSPIAISIELTSPVINVIRLTYITSENAKLTYEGATNYIMTHLYQSNFHSTHTRYYFTGVFYIKHCEKFFHLGIKEKKIQDANFREDVDGEDDHPRSRTQRLH